VAKLALSANVTLFDTAEGYGGGSSEVRLAEVLRQVSSEDQKRAVIMTKFLPTTWRWTESSFFAALKGCRDRLGRPVDIFYIHTPVHPLFHFWVECACKARKQGLITEIGLSNCGVQQIETAVEIASKHGQRIAANQVVS